MEILSTSESGLAKVTVDHDDESELEEGEGGDVPLMGDPPHAHHNMLAEL